MALSYELDFLLLHMKAFLGGFKTVGHRRGEKQGSSCWSAEIRARLETCIALDVLYTRDNDHKGQGGIYA